MEDDNLQINLSKRQLQYVYNMLSQLKIKGASINRARYRVIELLKIELKVLNHDKESLINTYAVKDAAGKLVVKDDQYQITSGKRGVFNQASIELMTEPVLITIDDYQPQFQKLYNFLNNYDLELEGTSAMAFGAFLDALEVAGIK